MAGTLRAFIAVPIPGPVAAFLGQIQARLRSPAMPIRWVATGNIHLTLKFLGDIAPAKVPAIAARMDTATAAESSFRLHARRVGVFPNRRNARVIWVGLDGDVGRLITLQADLASALEAIGFGQEDRRFQPHLTIGRSRGRIDAQTLGEALGPLQEIASDAFAVDRLMLFKSELTPAGAQYTRLHVSPLAIKPPSDGV